MDKLSNLNYYELLYLDKYASHEEIEKAYNIALYSYSKKSIATYSILSEEEREKALVRIKAAYNTLHDEKKRAAYDKNIFGETFFDKNIFRKTLQSKNFFRKAFFQKNRANPIREDLSYEFLDEDNPQNDDQNLSTITGGNYLKNIREIKGLSLSDISKKTMVGTTYLTAIEEERVEELPALIFAKGYIKAYAQCLGLNPKETLKKFDFSKLEADHNR